MRVRVSISHSTRSITSATAIMKKRVAGKVEHVTEAPAAAVQRASGAAPQARPRPSTDDWMIVKAGPCSTAGGENGTDDRPQTSFTTSRMT
jgi:hypothetical protein